jgi:NAD dependent epimerase/dehydratase family enzyme
MSWISLTDEVAAIRRILEDETLSGPINLTAPQCVTNVEWTQTLGRILGKPAFLKLPSWAVKTLWGEMGKELLLASQKVKPGKLMGCDFCYRTPTLEEALKLEGVSA